MKRRISKGMSRAFLIPVVVVVLVALAGCGGPAATSVATSTEALPTATDKPPTPTSTPTATIVVPTETSVPTATPIPPTAAPSVESIIARLKAAGLEAENTTPMTKDDYGMSPFVCTGVRFLVPSMGEDKGGRVFVCPNAEDLTLLKDYYDKLGKASAMFFSWTFAQGNVLIQINGDMPEDQARKYEAALSGK